MCAQAKLRERVYAESVKIAEEKTASEATVEATLADVCVRLKNCGKEVDEVTAACAKE